MAIKSTFAHYGWESRLPNGNYIKVGSKTICQVCHEYADPTTDLATRNAFGTDFSNASNDWNQALATKDSDGDSYSNASELNCSNYSWISGPCGSDQSQVANPGDPDISPSPAVEKHSWIRSIFMLSAIPNPFNPSTSIRIVSANPSIPVKGTLLLVSPAGKIIRTFHIQFTGNASIVGWNGTDDGNKPVASGIYTAAFTDSNGKRLVTRLILAR